MAEMTLDALKGAANGMGYNAEIVNTGGGVVALSFRASGVWCLVALDEGRADGAEWCVALDGLSREQYGEAESPSVPVYSDADQTVRDAVAWVLHAVRVLSVVDGDHEIAVRMQLAEILAEFTVTDSARFAEFSERFGEIAAENLASYCTGVHASAEEMLTLAACDFPRYRQVMLTGL